MSRKLPSDGGTERDQSRPKGRVLRLLRVRVVGGPDLGREVTANEGTLSIGTAAGNALVMTDNLVSRYHVALERDLDGIQVRDLESTNGTRIGQVRISGSVVRVDGGTELTIGRSTLLVEDAEARFEPLAAVPAIAGIHGTSRSMAAIVEQVHALRESTAPVVLLGESGTGKEVVARALHATSARAQGPFVVVDCGAMPTTLFQSELFGHERGAFTGAERQHVGAFERARGGTILLDELGELPPEQQVALLGALERKCIRRVGGAVEIPIDVRVIAATHRDLRAAVNAGRFRLDLYYRLAVVLVRMPPLRERREDIRGLVAHFLEREDATDDVQALVTEEILSRLEHHDWPGNVRELRNVVAALVATRKVPSFEFAPTTTASSDPIGATLERPFVEAKATVVHAFEHRYLTRLLERSEGNFRESARIAEMDRSHLLALLRKHGFR